MTTTTLKEAVKRLEALRNEKVYTRNKKLGAGDLDQRDGESGRMKLTATGESGR